MSYSLRWLHNAKPPDLDLVFAGWVGPLWVNGANLVLLGELRRRAPEAIDWGPLLAAGGIFLHAAVLSSCMAQVNG